MFLRINHALKSLPHIPSISSKVNTINYSEEFEKMEQFQNVEDLAIEYFGNKRFLIQLHSIKIYSKFILKQPY